MQSYHIFMSKVKNIFFLSFILFIVSCSTNVNINAPWKDITIVYGLLNQEDTIHFIKVNKAFLGDQSAYEMAQIPDSINYKEVKVTLKKVNVSNNNVVQVFNFRDTIVDKLDGIFATDNNKVYYYEGKILNDNENEDDLRYDLEIYIYDRNKTVTASTKLLNKVKIINPPYTDYVNINFAAASPYTVTWETSKGARLFQLKMKFHYYEINNNDTFEKTIDMHFSQKTSINSLGGQELSNKISWEDFKNMLLLNIEENPNVTRVVKKEALDFFVYSGSEEMYKYMQISSPTNSLVQDRPFYTNINNGVGLFTSRTVTERIGKKIDRRTIDKITQDSETMRLNFLDYEASTYFWSNLKNKE